MSDNPPDKIVNVAACVGLIRAIICGILGAAVIAAHVSGWWRAFSVACTAICDGIFSGIAMLLLILGLA